MRFAAAALIAQAAFAQSVPPEYQDLYSSLQQKVSAFDQTISSQWTGQRTPVDFSAEALTANCNRGLQLLSPATLAGVDSELDRLGGLGVKAVTVCVSFPILYQPFYQFNGDPADYNSMLTFYKQVAADVRARGMKLVVESGTMFTGYYSASSGFNLSAYYRTLSLSQLIAGRAQNAAVIASQLQPDYLQIGAEPDTEASLTGQPALNTPSGWARQAAAIVAAAGSYGVPLGAGVGTWTSNGADFIGALVTTAPGLSFIDLHVYPVNLGFLDNLTSFIGLAHSLGKDVTLCEAWLLKERDSEFTGNDVASSPAIFARDSYSFWAPLDQQFLGALVKLAYWQNLRVMSPFWSRLFWAYADYDAVKNLTPEQTIAQATTAAAAALVAGQTSSTGLAYQSLIAPAAAGFVPVRPCRVADTRNGGSPVAGGTSRNFAVPSSPCGIPAGALAYSLNVTVVPSKTLSYLTIWPAGLPQPFVSTLNSPSGAVVANAAIVPAGANGAVSVFVTDTTDVVLDINGYFDSSAGSHAFYPLPPCRVADTRGPNGALGGPSMITGQGRDFPVPASACGVPTSAAAYSMNATVVPAGPLFYLSMWPTGQALPLVSTLNSFEGKIVANAALVPAGANGGVSVYVTNPANVVLDIDGYFGARGGSGALSFYPVSPCRVADTRLTNGTFGGPSMGAAQSRDFPVPLGRCAVPAGARAYSLNITAVPHGGLGYLTVWPAGQAQPYVSTLNAPDGLPAANAAIVPAGTAGAVSVYVTDPADVVVDINGYFAP